jgi:hypothetical protein
MPFNHTNRYIDDGLSISNHNFHNYVHLIYLYEFKRKDKMESGISAIYLNIYLILTQMAEYDKCDLHQ